MRAQEKVVGFLFLAFSFGGREGGREGGALLMPRKQPHGQVAQGMPGHASGWRGPCWLTEKHGSGYSWDKRFWGWGFLEDTGIKQQRGGSEGENEEQPEAQGFWLKGSEGENREQPGAQRFRLKGGTSKYVCCSFWAHSYLSLYIIIIIIIFIFSATF